jgi:hypothetical protein
MKQLVLWSTVVSGLVCAAAAAQSDSQTTDQSLALREGATVFGLLLGKDTVASVASRVQLQDGSICKLVARKDECRPSYEIDALGYLRNKDDAILIGEHADLRPGDVNIFFAKFSVDGEYLTGTFYNDTLISLSVGGKYSSENIDFNVDPKALIASFDKKYKRNSPLVKSLTDNGVTDRYTYFSWQDSTSTFEVTLTRHESLLVNKVSCLRNLQTFLSLPDLYHRLKHRCEGSSETYQMEYRSPNLYMHAFEHARRMKDEAEAQKNAASSQRINKY